jgi:Domain of Unknown Function (DUF748).
MTAANEDGPPGDVAPATANTAASPEARPPRSTGRRIRKILLWVVAVVAVIAAIITFAPGPVARLVLHYYLDDLGIDVSGEQSLDVNLWKGRIAFGPVDFSFGDSVPGQVSRLGLDFSIPRLVKRRALVTTLTIEGLDLKLTQTPEGELQLNGVPLSGLLASEPSAEEQKTEETPEDAKSAWGAGLDSFELKNSKLSFVTQQGREAQLQIDTLDLIGFRTWQPDDPGTFSLAGQINGISVNAEGEARPFADELQVGLKYRIDGIELAKIEQFTGPLGFERNAGTFTLEGAGEINQLLKGGTSIASTGNLTIAGLDLAIPKAVAVGLQDAQSAFQLRTHLEPDGAFDTAGSLSLDVAAGHVQVPDGPDVTFEHATMPATDMALSLAADGGMALRGVPTLEITKPAMTGPINVTGNRLALNLTNLSLDSGAKGTDLTTNGTLAFDKPVVEIPAADGSQGMKVQSTGVEATLADVALKQGPDGTRITGGATQIKPGEMQLSLPQANAAAPPMTIAGNVSMLNIDGLAMNVTDKGMALTGKAATNVDAAKLTMPTGRDSPPLVATLDKLALTLGDLALNTAGNETRLKLSADAKIAALAGGNEAQAPAAAGRKRASAARGSAKPGSQLSAGPITIALPSFELTQRPDTLQMTATLSSEWSKLQGALRDIPARPSLAFTDLKLETSPLTLEMSGKGMRVVGKAGIALKDADAGWDSAVAAAHGQTVESKGSAADLSVALSAVDVRSDGGTAEGKAALRLDATRLQVQSPEFDTVAGGRIAVDQLQTDINEIKLGRPPAPAWRIVLDSTLASLSTGKENAIPRMNAKRVEIRQLAIDDRGSVDADAFIITKTDATISRSWMQRLGGDPAAEQVAKSAVEVAEKAEKEKAPLRIGRIRVEDGAQIVFEDDVLKPPARFALNIEAFDMGELNSAKPEGRTDLFLRAKLNEFTPIEAQGWAEVLAPKPDFALNASIKYLQLPQLSPYTAQAIGINIESGRLTVNADATANQGELQGVINLAANSLELGSVSAETASQAENTIGVPLNTALGLLEDDDGRIKLSIPLSGNLASPSFDPGDAIAQAMTNVVKGAVLAPFKLALLPVTLIAGAAEGSVPKLAPVTFESNTDTPDAQGKQILDSLATLLRDQPKLKVQVCGRATQQDRATQLAKEALPDPSDPIYPVAVGDMRAGLGQLAQARTSVVRRILSDEFGIPRRQVLECRSAYEEQDTGAPRVEIKF